MPHPKKTVLKGKVLGFNISPKGYYESVLIDANTETVQVNFSPEESARVAGSLKEGTKAEVIVEPEGGKKPSEHAVYKLLSIETSAKKSRHDQHPQIVKVKGKIVRLNYAKHGEVNGAILNDGCFVHLKPDGARAARLKIGQLIEMEGEEKLAPTHRVVDIYEINKKVIRTRK